MDVASTLPIQTIYRVFTGESHEGQVFAFLNLLRLWRLRRVSALFKRFKFSILVPTLLINVTVISNFQYFNSKLCFFFFFFFTRLEKDIRFSYFLTRLIKLVCVSTKCQLFINLISQFFLKFF